MSQMLTDATVTFLMFPGIRCVVPPPEGFSASVQTCPQLHEGDTTAQVSGGLRSREVNQSRLPLAGAVWKVSINFDNVTEYDM